MSQRNCRISASGGGLSFFVRFVLYSFSFPTIRYKSIFYEKALLAMAFILCLQNRNCAGLGLGRKFSFFRESFRENSLFVFAKYVWRKYETFAKVFAKIFCLWCTDPDPDPGGQTKRIRLHIFFLYWYFIPLFVRLRFSRKIDEISRKLWRLS
jgi:hypothetical protein